MKHTSENLRTFLDHITSKPNLAAASRAIGINETTIFLWLRRSATGDPSFLTRWPNDEDDENAEQIQFVEAVAVARKRFTAIFEHAMRNEGLVGIPRVQVKDGDIVWAKNPKWIGVSDDIMVLCGLDPVRDRYLRDKDGNATPLILNESAPAHLKIALMRGLLPNLFGDKSEVSIRHSGGVQIIGRRSGPVKPAPQIAEPVQQVEQQVIEQQPIEQTHPVNASAESIERLKAQLAERNARVAEMAAAKKPGASSASGEYQTLAMRGDPRVGQPARIDDPDDRPHPVLPGGHKVI